VPRADVDELVAAARKGERAALARLLSAVERGGEPARRAARLTHGAGAEATTIGLTGAPGAGKSTLTDALVRVVRRSGDSVAVLAVDPSSPFTGGAILGDRVRMGDHATDDGVFIRSMATRGHLGGLAVAAPDAVRVLTAAGFPWVVLETVGVGQVEVEVAGHTDTTVVVVNPGWGDAVQAAKAGLVEIADVFVVNKADRPGADEAVRDLERVLAMADRTGSGAGWTPPVVRTVAQTGEGVEELWSAIRRHGAHMAETGEGVERRRARAAEEVRRLVALRLAERARAITDGDRAGTLADRVAAGELDPWSAADDLLGEDGPGGPAPDTAS
jgi:LAO/AO transport system kinase